MLRYPKFLLYAASLLGGGTYVAYTGWSPAGPDVVKNLPRSIRDNPGAYRSHYANYSRYMGGK
jgi:hypothetical protein